MKNYFSQKLIARVKTSQDSLVVALQEQYRNEASGIKSNVLQQADKDKVNDVKEFLEKIVKRLDKLEQ